MPPIRDARWWTRENAKKIRFSVNLLWMVLDIVWLCHDVTWTGIWFSVLISCILQRQRSFYIVDFRFGSTHIIETCISRYFLRVVSMEFTRFKPDADIFASLTEYRLGSFGVLLPDKFSIVRISRCSSICKTHNNSFRVVFRFSSHLFCQPSDSSHPFLWNAFLFPSFFSFRWNVKNASDASILFYVWSYSLPRWSVAWWKWVLTSTTASLKTTFTVRERIIFTWDIT